MESDFHAAAAADTMWPPVTDEQKQQMLQRLSVIRGRLADACAESGRDVSEVTLMAVTKTVAPELINAAVDAGVHVLGENRVQEYLSKRMFYRSQAEVQFIGHLQTNKVKQIIGAVTLIHSVDSLHLAQAIDKAARQQDTVMPVLLEVNIGGEASKSGVSPAELPALLETAAALPNLEVRGLMTIPPPEPDEQRQEAVFAVMAALYRKMQSYAPLSVLSMGMSGDYAAAVRQGATLVRIGSALFGARHYPV